MERFQTGDIPRHTREFRSIIERSTVARGLLQLMGVLAVSMVMSDGVLTPAQSVLGAVQGASVVNPNLSRGVIVGTTCGILVLLFAIQPFGTTKIGTCFAPIIIIWLALNAAFGIYNLVKFDHSVLKAFSPYFAFNYLVRNKTDGWRSLGGILLSFTGVEALFADLGAFSRRAIQLSWFCYTFPCLLLAYVGQAAFISVHPAAYSNPFFNAAPPGTLYPSLIIAVLAAVVASQAIITATFQVRFACLLQGHATANMIIAHGTNYETLILPPDQDRAHLRHVSRTALRADAELADDDWNNPGGSHL
jgi:KUP system potassium uptake protein